eukprot:24523-Pleurochrysis_carterae.AAC.1
MASSAMIQKLNASYRCVARTAAQKKAKRHTDCPSCGASLAPQDKTCNSTMFGIDFRCSIFICNKPTCNLRIKYRHGYPWTWQCKPLNSTHRGESAWCSCLNARGPASESIIFGKVKNYCDVRYKELLCMRRLLDRQKVSE